MIQKSFDCYTCTNLTLLLLSERNMLSKQDHDHCLPLKLRRETKVGKNGFFHIFSTNVLCCVIENARKQTPLGMSVNILFVFFCYFYRNQYSRYKCLLQILQDSHRRIIVRKGKSSYRMTLTMLTTPTRSLSNICLT